MERAGVVTVEDYRRLVGGLAATANRRDAELAAAECSYQDGAAAAASELALASIDASEADRRASVAATAVVEVDREATRLWDELKRVRGWRGRRLGDLPPPAPADSLPPDAPPGLAVELLDEAARRIDQARRGAPRPALPRWLLPLLPPLGAAGATMTGLVAGGLVTMGHLDTGFQWPLRLLGWCVFLVAPFTSVPLGAMWVDRQFGSRLDTGAIGLIVLGGMTAGCGLSLLFAR